MPSEKDQQFPKIEEMESADIDEMASKEQERMQQMAEHVAEVEQQLRDQEQKIRYEPHYRCNFCSKSAERVFLLVQGPGVNICNECIMEGMELIQKEVVRRETKLNKVVKFETEEE
jgi:hypothetical protein